MCEVISAETILVLLLEKKERVSFRELRDIRSKIESNNKNIIVDITIPSIDQMLFHYPQIFMHEDKYICRAKQSEKYFETDYIKNEFLSNISDKVTGKLYDILSAV